MAFRKELCEVYDSIFPVRPLVIDFLSQGLSAGAKVLDVGCGTGGHSLALAQKGFRVTGIDLEQAMIETALEKELPESSEFRLMNMLELTSHFAIDSFDSVYCIGNALANLRSRSEVFNAISQFAQVLQDDGELVIQIVNYDRIPRDSSFRLPTIDNAEKGLRFKREYFPQPQGLLEFKTELQFQGLSHRDSSLVYPISSEELAEGIALAGFGLWELFGSYDSKPVDAESAGLILRAGKR
jgi:SAM-dependent methyltransferase